MLAALYVEKNGVYFGLPHVDPWDEERDARRYAGPHRVVAHPPCSRWCQLAYINQKRYGHKVGDDGGCFAAALDAVRAWGGVLEHPAFSYAWPAFELPRPPRAGWQRTSCGGWVAQVSQAAYGHRARKLTWLYYVGDNPPALDWSAPEPTADQYRTAKPIVLRCPECNTVDGKDIWCVINEDGFPEFAASVESYCHDHINDAILHKDKAASLWVVRRFRQVHFDPTKRTALGEEVSR